MLRTSTRLWLSALTAMFLTLAFPPFYLWPLALVALVPLSICALRGNNSLRWWAWYYLLGYIYFAVNLYWLIIVTLPGYVVLCFYLALVFPLYVFILRVLVLDVHLPALISVPTAWTVLEFLRGTLFTGFPWFTLGVALAPAPWLLQSADIFGMYGLTFLAGLVSGAVVDGMDQHGVRRWRSPVAATVLLMGTCGYGVYRLAQPLNPNGPTIGLIQRYIPQSIKNSPDTQQEKAMVNQYLRLSRQAAALHPDLIAWPETSVPGFLNSAWLSQSRAEFSRAGRHLLETDQEFALALGRFAMRHKVSLLVGSSAIHFTASGETRNMQNIAVLFTPTAGELPRYYAKRHLVPFGEYVPFKKSWPALHRFLLALTPFGPNDHYSLTPGKVWTRFTLTAGSQVWRFGVPICYEDVMSHPSRMFARLRQGKKGVDFLMSISNDGWYDSRPELQQHLQSDQLRAVENRVPIARCVNGGYCGFINSDGQIIKLVKKHGHSAFVSGFAVARLPLDSRITLFSRIGNLFPQVLVILCLVTVFLGLARRIYCRDSRR
ncbi:MAG: apolipoprotein N-acyltransferase [Phycisphaerae bacterium]